MSSSKEELLYDKARKFVLTLTKGQKACRFTDAPKSGHHPIKRGKKHAKLVIPNPTGISKHYWVCANTKPCCRSAERLTEGPAFNGTSTSHVLVHGRAYISVFPRDARIHFTLTETRPLTQPPPHVF